MDKWAEIFMGLVIVIAAVIVAFYSKNWTAFGHSLDFLSSAWIFFKGGLWWLVFMIGALFLLLGINDLRE